VSEMLENDPRIAIVGANGFIGRHLSKRLKIEEQYGRHNIQDLEKSKAKLFIVAAAPAAKWEANSNPEKDSENIDSLITSLQALKDKRCVLISTIDVFPNGVTFDEDSLKPESIAEAYGRNRGRLEDSLRDISGSTLILRLPGMYGPGLKKNLLYDLVTGKVVTGISPESTFQFYDVRNLLGHFWISFHLGLNLVHLATEPVSVADIYRTCFMQSPPINDSPMISYSMQTKFAYELSGRSSRFLFSSDETLAGIKSWASLGNSL
jgi:nucleoside-diphosphate-sugar epimerase